MRNSSVDVVLRASATNGESPVWDADAGVLWWVDNAEAVLHRFDPRSGHDERWTMPAFLGSIGLGRDAQMLLALRTGTFRFDARSAELRAFAPVPFDAHAFTWNDGKTDPAGRFWCGPMRQPLDEHGGRAQSPPLFRIAPDSTQRPSSPPCTISNGLAWSPDGRMMYHSDTPLGTIFAYDVLDAEAGVLGERRVFARAPHDGGGPDGAATDTDGCYWSAVYGSGTLVRFTPDGRVERTVTLPVPNPTMLAFGGPQMRTAYVTTAAKPLDARERERHPLWGALFAFDAPAPGVPIPPLDASYFEDA